MTQVAWSASFLKAVIALTSNEQGQVNKAVYQFQVSPDHPSLNFEKLTGCKDDKLCSIRANRDVRIILAATRKDQFVLLHVGHHEAAYQWANRRRLEINPYTGVLQCYAFEESVVDESAEERQFQHSATPAPFSEYRDRQLLALGVPESNLKIVRKIHSESDLEAALEASWLPQDAYHGLFMLLAGASYEEAYRESVGAVRDEVDTADFSAALQHPQTLANFTVAENEEELKAALSQSLEQWRVFLHPSQRSLVEKHWSGPACVLGAAGTGKTVVAIHRTKWLISNILDAQDKLLIVTFNVNLCADIQGKLRSFLPETDLHQADVHSIDSLALSFLKKNGVSAKVVFDSDPMLVGMWSRALLQARQLSFPDSFYREEWSQVVQPLRITTQADYLQADRTGRGVALSKMQRAKVWPIFEQVISELKQNNQMTLNDALFLASEMASSGKPIYRSVLIDETQDMSVAALRFIRSLAKPGENDLLFFGDPRQNIYMRSFSFAEAGIEIADRIDYLYINYRTSSEIQSLAESFLNQGSILSSIFSSYSDSKSHSLFVGVPASVKGFQNLQEEMSHLGEVITSLVAEGVDLSDICVVCRTKSMRNKVSSFLDNAEIKTYLLGSRPDERSIEGVRLATFHRVKGLEFRHVFLFGCGESEIPPRQLLASTVDPIELSKIDSTERSLAYVAATRARERLYISYTGEPCQFLKALDFFG